MEKSGKVDKDVRDNCRKPQWEKTEHINGNSVGLPNNLFFNWRSNSSKPSRCHHGFGNKLFGFKSFK